MPETTQRFALPSGVGPAYHRKAALTSFIK